MKKRFDIVDIHQLPPPASVFFFGGLPRLVVSTWGSDIIDFESHTRHPRLNFSRCFVLHQAQAVTASYQYLASTARSFTPSATPIHVIPFGVEWRQFAHPPFPRPSPPPIRLVITKHLEPIYGIHYLLDSLRLVSDQIRDIELLIAGNGSQRSELEAHARRLALQNKTTFLGHLEHTRIKFLLYQSHTFVMLSLCEALGVAALEAQATGLPVIASRVGGIPEVVLDGKNGLLVPPKNASALAAAIIRLVNDSEFRQQIGHTGQEFV